MLGVRVPQPDEVMLISGGKAGGREGQTFRISRNRKFVMPMFNRVGFLSLSMREAKVREECVSNQGVKLVVTAVCAFTIADADESITNAGKNFLSGQAQMETSVGQIFAGHLREVVGGMSVEQIVNEREVLRKNVLQASKEEMSQLGLSVKSFQIQTIEDPSGYIEAMRRPHQAAIEQKAKIAEAAAAQASSEQEQASLRNQAQYARDTAIAQANFQAEQQSNDAAANQRVAIAQAEADRETRVAQANAAKASQEAEAELAAARAKASQAGPLAEARATQEVTQAQTLLATQAAELRQQQLLAEVVRPAEAQAEVKLTLAKAETEATKMAAAAAAANDRVSLDQRMIELLPDVAGRLADGLAQANVTVLNGAPGLSEFTAGVLQQGMAILNQAREFYKANGAEEEPPPSAPMSGYLP